MNKKMKKGNYVIATYNTALDKSLSPGRIIGFEDNEVLVALKKGIVLRLKKTNLKLITRYIYFNTYTETKSRPLFKAPCNITKNNTMQIDSRTGKLLYVRYACGKIKWSKIKKGDDKNVFNKN